MTPGGVGVGVRDAFTAAHCHVLRRLHATCGAASGTIGDDALAVALAGLATQFAWHAELLYDLLPVRADVDREALVSQGAPGADGALSVLEEALGAGRAAESACVLARVLVPRLAVGIAAASAVVDPDLDAPRARALTLIGRDLAGAHLGLEAEAERLLAAGGEPALAAKACLEAERWLLAAGATGGLWRTTGLTPPVE